MKVVWVVNIMLPDLCDKLNVPRTVIGGWLHESARRIRNEIDELVIVTTKNAGDREHHEINGIHYYLLPTSDRTKFDNSLNSHWKDIFNHHSPDILHIHGTEFSPGLAALNTFGASKTVVSIQGLVSVYARYYTAGISLIEILSNISFRDVLKGTILHEQRKFVEQGRIEIEYLKQAEHVIGRTDWDFVHTATVNPKLCYHFCNETLRKEFYSASKWNVKNIKKYRIFISQAGYPIKGLHQVLRAAQILKTKFPQIKIAIGGSSIIKNETFRDKLSIGGYGKYIRNLIREMDLEENLEFLGVLDAKQMIEQYQSAHIFICPSSIENSPNSVGEAQIIGVPVVASYVGGTPNMIQDSVTGLLYRFEEYEMLANKIAKIFNDDSLAMRLSEKAAKAGQERHSLETNLENLLAIYQNIKREN